VTPCFVAKAPDRPLKPESLIYLLLRESFPTPTLAARDVSSTMPSSTIYSYREVDAAHQGFRIAILEPAVDFQAPICCSLIEVTVAAHPKYEAISYVWGDPNNQASISVENSSLNVTINLELALRYIRLKDEKRLIWADAICIDQSNIEERGQQVQLMKDIYTLCTRDLIWLGDPGDQSDVEQGIGALTRMQSLDYRRRGDKVAFNKKISDEELGTDVDSSIWLSIYEILDEPKLWERVWVMQEIACSPDALILIGAHSMPWSVLSGILDHSGIPDRFHGPFSHATDRQSLWNSFARAQVIEHQRDSISKVQPINSTLMDVLSRFRNTYSTDPRDKIYGLLGLATDGQEIIPDYNKSVQDVYLEVVQKQIEKEQNLDMITQSLWPLGPEPTDDSPSSNRTEIPSWLPNFSSTQTQTLLFAQRSIFAAGPPTFKHPIDITPAGKLRLHGAFLGTIKSPDKDKNGTRSVPTYVPYELRASEWTWSNIPYSLLDSNFKPEPYPTGGDTFEAYWRTLMADCTMYPARRLSQDDIESYSKIFKAWSLNINVALPDQHWSSSNGSLLNEKQKAAYDACSALSQIRSLEDKMRKWKFAELSGGLYALVPGDRYSSAEGREAREEDGFVVLDGGKVPLAVRRVGEGRDEWEVLGTAYVHGFMDGRAMEWVEEGKLEWRSITLV
jgi:hypothetical protein